MAFKLTAYTPYEYLDLYSGIIKEYKDVFPFTKTRETIRELIDRGIIHPITTPEGYRRYIVERDIEIVEPEFIGVDKTTGQSIYYDGTLNTYSLRDSEGRFIRDFGKLQIRQVFSIDTHGHQRLLVECMISTRVNPMSAKNIRSIEAEMEDKLDEAGSFYFTPEALVVKIKIGIEYLSEREPPSAEYPEMIITLIYRNEPMQTGKVIEKTYSQFQAEKAEYGSKFGKMRAEGIQVGRPRETTLEEFGV